MHRFPPALQSILLLVLGSTLLWAGASLFGSEGPAGAGSMATLYYKVVFLKGLLPQLLLTLAFMPLIRRFRIRRATAAHAQEANQPGPASLFIECFIMAALAYCAVAPFLLTVEIPGWPALRMIDANQRMGNFLAMTASIAALVSWPLSRHFAQSRTSSPTHSNPK